MGVAGLKGDNAVNSVRCAALHHRHFAHGAALLPLPSQALMHCADATEAQVGWGRGPWGMISIRVCRSWQMVGKPCLPQRPVNTHTLPPLVPRSCSELCSWAGRVPMRLRRRLRLTQRLNPAPTPMRTRARGWRLRPTRLLPLPSHRCRRRRCPPRSEALATLARGLCQVGRGDPCQIHCV